MTIEQQLLEANARIEGLEAGYADCNRQLHNMVLQNNKQSMEDGSWLYDYQDINDHYRVLREPPSQSLKLHDADVIERFAIYYLDKTGSNIGFGAENYARRLRNSVKEGE